MVNKPHDNQTSNHIQSVHRAFELLETVQRQPSATLASLADELNISKSTVHNHIMTLQKLGYLDRENDEYVISIDFLEFGGYALANHQPAATVFEAAKPEIDNLAKETGENVHLMIERDGKGIIIYFSRGDRAVKTDVYQGMSVDLHCTSMGKAVLAFLSEERIQRILDQGLSRKTQNTITDHERLRAELKSVRERGIAFDNGERFQGMRCIGAPIRINDDHIVGAISLSGPSTRMRNDRYEEELPESLKNIARVIEIQASKF